MSRSLLRERIFKALHEKNAIQRYLSRKAFPALQSLGFHVTGDHFYEPIPNTKLIQARYTDEPRPHLGADYSLDVAESLLVPMLRKWGPEFSAAAASTGYLEKNFYFSGLDSITLYCVIRQARPSRIIEIGQGMSTRIILAAALANFREAGTQSSVSTIDPYPRFRDRAPEGIELGIIQQELQDVTLTLFENLEDSDIVFVDSSHVYKFGSDVEHLFDHVYPLLPRGVILHIHDIFSPYQYPLDWLVKERKFWNEQYFLEGFLQYNQTFRIMLPVYYLQRQSARLREACQEVCTYPGFKYRGSSFYLQRASGPPSVALVP
jgi:hypothetical protein